MPRQPRSRSTGDGDGTDTPPEESTTGQPTDETPPEEAAPPEADASTDETPPEDAPPDEQQEAAAVTPGLEVAESGIGDGTESCKICEKPIEEGEPYLKAAYGSVHLDTCSHQPYVADVEATELSSDNE